MDLSQAMQALKRPADDPAHVSARLVVYHNLRRISHTLRRGPSDPLMEDFVHDIFVDLLKRPHRNIRQRSRAYLRRAIDNKRIDHHRKFSREAPYVMESVGSEDHGHKIAELKDELKHFFEGVLPSLLDAPALATAQTLLKVVTGSQTLTAAIRAEVGPDANEETLARTRGRLLQRFTRVRRKILAGLEVIDLNADERDRYMAFVNERLRVRRKASES